jgi:DNA-binding MarR family transcriptional regulator
MQWIADALNLDKRDVGKILKSLETKGWLIVEHGTRGRGKNHVNRYRPNAEKVASMTPFKDAVERAEQERAEQEKVAPRHIKGGKTSTKGGAGATLSGLTLSDVLRTDTADLRSASRSQSGEDAHTDPRFLVRRKLESYEQWLKAGSNRPLTPSERKALQGWLEFCAGACEAYDAHTGDPIGGRAYRLAQELSWLLEQSDDDHGGSRTLQ